jgi:hypothetical protein
MMRNRLLSAATLCIALISTASSAQTVSVEAEGTAPLQADMAAARDEALWDAKRNAVERAAGLMVRSRTVARNFSEAEDLIVARTEGVLRSFEYIPNSETVQKIGGASVLTLRIRARVELAPLLDRLAANRQLYDDLERPTLRLVEAGSAGGPAAEILTEALRRDGFSVVTGRGQVEIVLSAAPVPTLAKGDASSPYGLGETVSACRTRLELALWNRADDSLLGRFSSQAVGFSFAGDTAARTDAVQRAAQSVLTEHGASITRLLLTAWTRERIEGHAVQLRVEGISPASASSMALWLQQLRGTVGEVHTQTSGGRTVFRFRTRLDNRTLQARLSQFGAESIPLVLVSSDGPLMEYRSPRPAAGAQKGGADRRKGTP